MRLPGWYEPSHNRAAVVLVHGGGSDRTGTLAQAEVLARHGYGVLLYDARGRGNSDRAQNGFGWGWPRDLSGALRFLNHRPDVDTARIGGLGLSTGAGVLLEAFAEDGRLKAVVADGPGTRSGATAGTPLTSTAQATSGCFVGPATSTLAVRFTP